MPISKCVHACKVTSVMSDSLQPCGLYIACQAPLSMEFSRQEYWSQLPCPFPGDLPNPGIKPRSPALQADSLLSEPRRRHAQRPWGLQNQKKPVPEQSCWEGERRQGQRQSFRPNENFGFYVASPQREVRRGWDVPACIFRASGLGAEKVHR